MGLSHALPDFFIESSFEEFEQQILLSLVGGIVVQGEDHSVHKLCGLVLGHLEDELRQVGRVGLRKEKKAVSDTLAGFAEITHQEKADALPEGGKRDADRPPVSSAFLYLTPLFPVCLLWPGHHYWLDFSYSSSSYYDSRHPFGRKGETGKVVIHIEYFTDPPLPHI